MSGAVWLGFLQPTGVALPFEPVRLLNTSGVGRITGNKTGHSSSYIQRHGVSFVNHYILLLFFLKVS